MTYKKLLVDNMICSRRFHLTFDDSDKKKETVAINCPHCGIEIFKQKNHPPVKLARDENLITKVDLSSQRVFKCNFKDQFPAKTKT